MNPLTADQISALRELRSIWPEERFVIIGAAAMGLFLDMHWRTTYDLDLTLSVGTSSFPGGLSRRTGWSNDPKCEHRWIGPGGVAMDILPVGSEELSRGSILWPSSGYEMGVQCFGLAFSESVPTEVGHGVTVGVAPPWIVVLLKMIAYLDRPAERERDLADIAAAMEQFAGPDHDERFSSTVVSRELTYEQVSPFLLGKQLGQVIDDPGRRFVTSFLAKANSDVDPDATRARLVGLGPVGWRTSPEEMVACLDAFRQGLLAG